MILIFQVENLTDKETDDLSNEIFGFITSQGILVTDYWIDPA